MREEDSGPVDRKWRDAFASLREGVDPPPELEARVTAGLRRRQRGGRRLRLSLAAILLLATGAVLGWSWRPGSAPPVTSGSRFMLLLFEGPEYDSLSATRADRVAEYRAWAEKLAGRGQLIDGAELAPAEDRLGPMSGPGSGGGLIAGFFIVRAKNAAEALAIARTCPHLLHGGGVAVRPLTDS